MASILQTPRAWPKVTLARSTANGELLPFRKAERAGAWAAWRQVADREGPDTVIRQIGQAGLRGRGGAGYRAADKWRQCLAIDASQKYVVANGYEADPGTFTDRLLMERDPHSVIEGLAIAAYAVGATKAIVAVNAGYAKAIGHLRGAIAQAEEAGLIGVDALDGAVTLTVEVRPVQGAFLLGEETVLLRALEGKRGMPEQRPPYPVERGLFGKPTVVHNVETLATVPWIMTNGHAAFAAIGTAADGGSSGTKLVQLAGAVARPGVAEVPLGTPLGEIVERAGGGMRDKAKMKLAIVGGPLGGLLPADQLGIALDFDALRDAGATLGSGSIVLADDSACAVDLGRLLERFASDEACGKTIPCRIGLKRLVEIADRFASGHQRPQDRDLLVDLSEDVIASGLCNHERLAPDPLLSGLRYFAAEYDAHLNEGRCPAGVCAIAAVSRAPASGSKPGPTSGAKSKASSKEAARA
jgi:NADH:ubiquinone oxidoreductase subunit F (NADH-binding)